MTDLVQLQEDISLGLLSWDALATINVVQDRKLRLQQQTDATLIYLTLRNGRKGCGILVEMPTIEIPAQSAPGPASLMTISCLVIEEPTTNFGPQTGTLTDAETVARRVLMFLHGWLLEGRGELYADRRAIVPVNDLAGVIAYRVTCPVRLADTVMTRCSTPAISEAGLVVTLTGAAEEQIYYTLDESFPGAGNPGAQLYQAPFAVDSSTVVRWAAYRPDYLPSSVGRATIS